MPNRRTALCALVCASLLAPAAAGADWPLHRHDVHRTATADGASAIAQPAPVYRTYLGGSLGVEQYVAYDVDGEGRSEVVFVMGGALRAKTADDAVVWETAALDIFRVDGLWDLDADGTPEVVASARAGAVHVVRVTDGALLWSLPGGIVGNVGAVRFADFDGDGVTDLYLAEAACGSTGALGDVGQAYSFAGGFEGPSLLFELERGARDYICGQRDTVADVDGDGALEVIAQGRYRFYVYSTSDGSLESTSEDVGSIPYGQGMTQLADVDDDGRPELVVYTNNNYAPPVNSRRVFLMDWDEVTSALVKRWEVSVADLAEDRHGHGRGGLGDLDGDGDFEIATSFYTAATSSWRTVVLDAATGDEIASVSAGPFRGLADLTGDGVPEVLTNAIGGGAQVLSLTAGALEPRFTASGLHPVNVRVPQEDRRASAHLRPLALDLDGDGDRELIGQTNEGGALALVAIDGGSGDPPTEQARLAIEEGVALSTFEVFSGVTRDAPQILVARSDGYLWVLDDALRATNVDTGGEIPQRGLRIGGYYTGAGSVGTAPLAADLDGDGADDILVRDSRGIYRLIQPAGASLVEPPAVRWEVPAGLMSIVDVDGDGDREVAAAFGGSPPAVALLAGDDASEIWRRSVGNATTSPSHDLIAGDVTGDGVDDVLFQLRDSSGGEVVVNVLEGDDGAPLWASDYRLVVAGSGLGAPSLFDRDGDERPDVLITPRNQLMWLSSADGTTVSSANGGYPGAGVFVDATGDGETEILTSGAVGGVRAYLPDLSATVWEAGTTSPDRTQHTRIMGAPIACDGSVRFVQAHHASPRLTAWDGASGAIVVDVSLRGGVRYPTPDGAPDGPGTLGNVTASPDLTGAGTPAVLVPSSDGFLYAIEPCELSVLWTVDFRFPVGEAIFADTDGDGEDEIVVTVADGFLYGIDQEVIAAPAWVVETAGPGTAAGPEEDVDEVVARDTLHASWAPVEGATSYEYAVITPGGAFLTRPNFIHVSDATSVVATELPLTEGRRYLFAVRAIGPEGASGETLSDGALVLPDPCDACRDEQICVDGVCMPDPCFGVECGPGTVCRDGVCASTSPDAGVVEPGPDGGAPGVDGGTTMAEDDGCGCAAPGSSRRSAGASSALVLLALLGARRRTRR